MIGSRCKKINYFMTIFFFSVSINTYAGSFSDSFKKFIVGADQSNVAVKKRPEVALPEMSHSTKCMGCHDGSKATGVVLKHADTTIKFTGHGSSNHPVGMNYRSYATKDPVLFVSPERLDNRIILENGDVTCISCHSLIDTSDINREGLLKTSAMATDEPYLSTCIANKNELTTGSDMTTLCLSCHAM